MIDPANPDYKNTPVSPIRPHFGYSPANPSSPPYVTIVTPFYNTGPVFHETARSVLRQSFQQWEWLIVDDGSTEAESLAILESYRNLDPRIRVIGHSSNRGLSAARNSGFRAARSQYVVQLDGDDLLEPTAVEKWLWFLESYPEFGFVKGYSVGFGAEEYLWQNGFHDGRAFLDENMVDATSMIRKAVHQDTGGYDESTRGGLEDWDFWLRCASFGHWGSTVPEFLDWYRRRPNHADRWTNLNAGRRQEFKEKLRQRYPRLWNGGFPEIQLRWHSPDDLAPDVLPCENRLRKDKPRLLMILPWLTLGGADKLNLDLLRQLIARGWEVTLATTLTGSNPWLPQFAQCTPDVFILNHFLRPIDHPRFLRYLIQSRQVDRVLIANSELGYLLLPYLRAHFPDIPFVDFCHMEEEQWRNGGYPRMSVDRQELLDLNVVSSEHLKNWMARQGADPQRIAVCYTNVDPEEWRPEPEERAALRRELKLDAEIPLILHAGRICPQKQPRVLAETLLRLRRQNTSFVALVAGDGPDLEWLRSFVDEHQLKDSVRLLGAVPNEYVKRLMAAADIFFLPSRWEGISLAIYEAMASGLSIVSAKLGGQAELVTPDCGVLIEPGDEMTEADHYARALAELLGDPDRRREMGQAGRERVSAHHRLEQMGERMAALLEEAGRLRSACSRQAPSLTLGRLCATQAVERIRLHEMAEQLWRENEEARGAVGSRDPNQRLLDPYTVRWRTLLYYTVTRFPLPYYKDRLTKKMRSLLRPRNG